MEDRKRTLQAFRQAFTVESDAAHMSAEERAEEGIPSDAPSRVPVSGVRPSHLMAARWCTMLDAVHEIGRTVYGDAWTASILADKPHFPYTDERPFMVFRDVAWRHRPSEQSWGMALGAYAMLCDAMSEGLVRTVAECLESAPVPRPYEGAELRTVYVRERVPIEASDWRRDAVVMKPGLVASLWTITRRRVSRTPRSAAWVVLVERESLAEFLECYAHVLTEDTVTDAVAQRGRVGRPPGATREQLERDVVPRWEAGEWTSYTDVDEHIRKLYGVGNRAARSYREQVGICDKGHRAKRLQQWQK